MLTPVTQYDKHTTGPIHIQWRKVSSYKCCKREKLPASKLEPRLAAMVAPITTLAVCETEVTAVEGGRYLITWYAAVLGLPARLVVTPASTDTLHSNENCSAYNLMHLFPSSCFVLECTCKHCLNGSSYKICIFVIENSLLPVVVRCDATAGCTQQLQGSNGDFNND